MNVPGTVAVSELYDATHYETYWAKLAQIEALMREAQALADELRNSAEQKLA